MSDDGKRSSARQMVRLIGVAVGLAPLVLGSIVAFFWVQTSVPTWVYWKMGLIFLVLAEIAYVAVLTLAIPGTLLTGALLVRGSKSRRSMIHLARGFLLGMSIIGGLAIAEAGSAVARRLADKSRVVTPGGVATLTRSDPAARVGMPPLEQELPIRFADPPGDREIDMVVVGESSAEGVPYQDWLSIGQIVKWQLGEVLPDRPVRVKIVAKSGEDLEQQHQRLRQLTRRPDLLIIYCGHNEFQARFHALRDLRYYLDDQELTLSEVLVDRLERASPLCGWIHEASEKCRIAIPPPAGSSRRLVDVPAFTILEFQALVEDFERRLDVITAYAQRVGAIPLLIAPPANDAGFEPNRSFLPASTPRSDRSAFAREFLEIRSREAREPAASINGYRDLLSRQPGFAEAHYRLARLLGAAGDWEGAYSHYVQARDLDGYPTRAPTAFQQAYREVARRRSCPLVDGQAVLHSVGPHGMLDDSLFQDAMHPSLRGYVALAQAVLQELQKARAFGWPQSVPAPTIDPAACAAHFHMGREAWRHACHWAVGFYFLMAPLRYDPSTRLQQAELNQQALERIDAGAAPESLGMPNLGILNEPTRSDAAGRFH